MASAPCLRAVATLLIGAAVVTACSGSQRTGAAPGTPPIPGAPVAAGQPGGVPRPTGPAHVTTVHGNLLAEVVTFEAGIPKADSEGFVHPSDADLTAFGELVDDILAGRTEAAAAIAANYGYELVRFIDKGDHDAESLLLREPGRPPRGWGMYLFRQAPVPSTPGTAQATSVGTAQATSPGTAQATSPGTAQATAPGTAQAPDPAQPQAIIVEAPHPLADAGTPALAVHAYRAVHARALLVAGTHRRANLDRSADVAHQLRTVFEVVHERQAAGMVVLQFHGFSARKHPGYPKVILGTDEGQAGSLPEELAADLKLRHIRVGLCNGIDWRDLCGVTNVQSRRTNGGRFIHFELDDTVRDADHPFLKALRAVLVPTSTPTPSNG